MNAFLSPMERIKQLIGQLQKLEDELMSPKPIPMKEQLRLQEEVKKVKEEMKRLEGRVKK